MKHLFIILTCFILVSGFSACTPLQTKISGETYHKTERSVFEIQLVIDQHIPELRKIHRELLKNRQLGFKEGVIVFQFEINPDGSVGNYKIVKNTFFPLIGEKIKSEVLTWKFEPIYSVYVQTVELPLAFTED